MKKKLKIAQVASIWLSVPPRKYGGAERIVYYLTEELIKQGHEVTLFASGDSKTSAKLSSIYPKNLYDQGVDWLDTGYDIAHIFEAYSHSDKFDIIHCHVGSNYEIIPASKLIETPVVYTFHGNLPTGKDHNGRRFLLEKYSDQNFVSISNSQRDNLPLNFVATVYNGVDLRSFDYCESPDDYLIFLGRITPKKGIVEAIKASQLAKKKLIILARVDRVDREFYEKEVKPLIDGRRVVFLGEADDRMRNKYLRKALGILVPIKWREPFGLVMIEAMACGTPVIAFDEGAVPEIVGNERNGFIVKDVKEMARAVKKLDRINRSYCRKYVEEKFTIEKMTLDYEKVYYKVLRGKQ